MRLRCQGLRSRKQGFLRSGRRQFLSEYLLRSLGPDWRTVRNDGATPVSMIRSPKDIVAAALQPCVRFESRLQAINLLGGGHGYRFCVDFPCVWRNFPPLLFHDLGVLVYRAAARRERAPVGEVRLGYATSRLT